jgi:hypothetical protein
VNTANQAEVSHVEGPLRVNRHGIAGHWINGTGRHRRTTANRRVAIPRAM